jgi:GT2 family glycosyltransferase
VCLAYVHGNHVSHSWEQSKLDMIGWDAQHEQRLIRGGWIGVRYGTGGLIAARNEAASQFLAGNAEWLLWTDTDMGFAPDTADRLVDAADPAARPIIGALCFAWRETATDGTSGFRCEPAPTIFDWVEVKDGASGFLGRRDYPINQLVQCAGTGAACILIHRTVLERVHEKYRTWYERVPNPDLGQLTGEDLSFCLRAGSLGFPIHVHTGIKTTHHKELWVGERDYWRSFVPPPATEDITVIVPVLHRPHNAKPFMASLRASTGLATVHAVADIHDMKTREAWLDAGATVLVTCGDGRGTFAEKVNIGYRECQTDWMFVTGDDVRFHAGWLDHAQHVARTQDADVIGTNDAGNPSVVIGDHATHLLIRRSYVDEHGASWDGPKVVCHEGYGHWWVDDEIVTVAKQRGRWAMALGSVVEHMHPLWGKGEHDDVYALGQSSKDKDAQLFHSRCARYLTAES